MKRSSVRWPVYTFLAIVFGGCLVGSGVTFFQQLDIVFLSDLSPRRRLTIRWNHTADRNTDILSTTYHQPPGFEFVLGEKRIPRRTSAPTFSEVRDPKSGVRCVFDNDSLGYLAIYDPETDEVWDSIAGSPHVLPEWQARLDALREQGFPIPYRELPAR